MKSSTAASHQAKCTTVEAISAFAIINSIVSVCQMWVARRPKSAVVNAGSHCVYTVKKSERKSGIQQKLLINFSAHRVHYDRLQSPSRE